MSGVGSMPYKLSGDFEQAISPWILKNQEVRLNERLFFFTIEDSMVSLIVT